MPRGDKSSYTAKQKRQARDIEKSYEHKGVSEEESARRAWATVNKLSGGGMKGGGNAATSAKSTVNKSGAKKSGSRKTAITKAAAQR